MKRIVTLQDVSCVGKCALTVALPVISAMGVETAVIPTALLSTHSVFPDFEFTDLTDHIAPISGHLKSQGITFDAIYTGYLGSQRQIQVVSDFFDEFKTTDNFIFVDPAMADQGRLYTGFDMDFAKAMTALCRKADIIDPNITEACFMTGKEYKESYDMDYVKDLMLALHELGAKNVILTGVSFREGKTGVMGYDGEKGEFSYYGHDKLPQSYHGTGDIFASTFVGAMMNGMDWRKAVMVAADYTAECIRVTIESGKEKHYGVDFESCVPYLLKRLAIES